MPAIEFHPVYHSNQNEIFYGSNAKTKIVPKGRRFGLTQGYSTFTIENLLAGVKSALWVDTVQGNIESYFERYFVPQLKVIPQRYWSWNKQRKQLHILGNYCDFRSAERPDLLEGFGYHLILLNEAGIILRDRYLWENAIKPMTLDHDPDVIIGGTPKGGGLFEEMAANAAERMAAGDPRFWTKTYTSYDNPFIKSEQIDLMASEIPELVREQEIYGKFNADKGSVFRRLKEAIDDSLKALPHCAVGRKYYMGVDLAKHVDWTVIVVLDDLGKMVYFNRFHKLDWEYQQRVIIEAAALFRARVLIDSTGIGDPIFDALKSKGLTLEGYKISSTEAKKKLIEGLMLAFEMAKVRIFDDQILKDELRLFGYEISPSGILRYGAPEGHHDDCVIALALAWMCKENMKPQSGFAFSERSIY